MKLNGNMGYAIKNAICQYVLFNLSDRLSDEDFYKVLKFIDTKALKNLDDRDFINNERLKRFVNYHSLDRKQLIRLMTIDLSIYYRLTLNEFQFKVHEVELFLANHPQKIREFNFDLQTLTGREIIILLKADLNYIYELTFDDKRFSRLEFQDLIKYFHSIDEVIEKINFELLDSYLTRTLIIYTGIKYIDKLVLSKLNYLDWLAIAEHDVMLMNYCPIQVFETGDYFKLAKLVCAVPQLSFMIEKHKDDLAPLDWEKLILHDYDRYKELCAWEKFKEINWRNMLNKNPLLIKHKLNS